jgi:general secretion pathway protein A
VALKSTDYDESAFTAPYMHAWPCATATASALHPFTTALVEPVATSIAKTFMPQTRPLPLAHWGFVRWPFRSVPAAEQFYPTPGHNEALARIEYLVDARRRLGALLGEAGIGKSLVLDVAARQLARQGNDVVRVDSLGVSTRELLWQIAGGLGTGPRDNADVQRLWREIVDRVAENRLQQIATVLLVDDAGSAGPDATTQLVRLARLEPTPAARWTIVLAAEPGQAALWNESLRELVDLRIDLAPWELADSIGYVQTALVEAGRFEPLFDDDTLALLHELSSGVPRRLVRLADFSLLAAAAAGVEKIDRGTVAAAHEELAWPVAAGAAF